MILFDRGDGPWKNFVQRWMWNGQVTRDRRSTLSSLRKITSLVVLNSEKNVSKHNLSSTNRPKMSTCTDVPFKMALRTCTECPSYWKVSVISSIISFRGEFPCMPSKNMFKHFTIDDSLVRMINLHWSSLGHTSWLLTSNPIVSNVQLVAFLIEFQFIE